MTASKLQELLVAERDWRLSELEFCKKIPFVYVHPTFRPHRDQFWRLCVPIIYAHWEGFVTSSLKTTIDYINELELPYASIPRHLVLLEGKKRFGYLQGNCTKEQQNRFLDEFFAVQNTYLSIDRGNISANSNLNFKQLEIMLEYLNISISPTLQAYKPQIERLVWFRNSIAHGENCITVKQKDIEQFIQFESICFDEIIRLLLDYITCLPSQRTDEQAHV